MLALRTDLVFRFLMSNSSLLETSEFMICALKFEKSLNIRHTDRDKWIVSTIAITKFANDYLLG